jgi:hypothetical protein
MVTPIVPSLAAVYVTSGTTATLTNEAMNSTDESFTAYEITNVEKRYLDESVAPVFEADTAGNGTFATITGTIQYVGGRIILAAPRGEEDVVRCASGKAFVRRKLLGASIAKLNSDNSLVETPLLGEGFVRRIPVMKDFSFTCDAYMVYTNETGEDCHDVSAMMDRPLIVQMYVNTTSDERLEGIAYLESDDLNLENKGVVMHSLSFKGSGELYYREG